MPAPQEINQNKLDDEDLLGGMDDMLADLDKAIKSNSKKALDKVVTEMLDEDAVPPHLEDDDSDGEPPVRKSKKSSKAKAQADDETSGDEGDDDDEENKLPDSPKARLAAKQKREQGDTKASAAADEGGDSAEDASGDDEGDGDDESGDSSGDHGAEGEGSAARTTGPSAAVKALRRLNYKVPDDLDEDQAADLLVQHHERVAAAANDNAQLIELGKKVLSSPDMLKQVGGQGGSSEATDAAKAVADAVKGAGSTGEALKKLSALGSKWKELSKKPEFDPEWEHSGVQFNGRMYVAPAGRVDLAPIAEKLNTYRKWQLRQLEEFPSDLQDIIETTMAAINERPTGALTEERLREIIRQERGSSQRDSVARRIAEENAHWMFMRGQGGELIRDPSKNPIFTPHGKKYEQYFELLRQRGMDINTAEGLQSVSDLAITLVGRTLDAEKKVPPKKTAGVDAQQAVGKKQSTNDAQDDDKARRLKDREKSRAAGGSGKKAGISSGVKGNEDDRASQARKLNPLKTLEKEFAAELGNAGITDSNVTFGEEADDAG